MSASALDGKEQSSVQDISDEEPDASGATAIEPEYLLSYRKEPDYERPLLEIDGEDRERIVAILTALYGDAAGTDCYEELARIMRVFWAHKTEKQIAADASFDPTKRFSHRDVILTTYGDLILDDEPPLRTLRRMLETYARYITTVHVLPFFPYSSDRGFSIVDYEEVDPELGSWEEIEQISTRFEVMFDGVINHVSSKSKWFQEFLNGNPRYKDYFIGFSTREEVSEDHLKLILRPRASDLLTRVRTIDGPRYVWTTFSADQIDLNYKNPRVLLRILEVLLLYVRRGADMIRLDAATYLWHELGTSSAHMWETHAIIRLFRAVLDVVAPRVALVTETNVPHRDNVSYFGNGTDEAQMVYNFALPPLVVLTFQTGSAQRLSQWAAKLEKVSDRATYLNFLDSHDGIGLLPIRELVPHAEVEALIERAREHGGLVSYRVDEAGNKVPYEINITWWSVLNRADSDEPQELRIDRFIASRSIALALRGVPALYLLGAIGSDNDIDAVTSSGEARAINRTAIDADALIERIDDHDHRTGRIFRLLGRLLRRRARCSAFHPNGAQRVLFKADELFTVLRVSPDGQGAVVAVTNVTGAAQRLDLTAADLEGPSAASNAADADDAAGVPWSRTWRDLVSGRFLEGDGDRLAVELGPYAVAWLRPRYQEEDS